MQTPTTKNVSYFYDDNVGNFSYHSIHIMRPFRLRMTHDLIESYGLYKKLYTCRPSRPTAIDFTKFHTDEYVHFLESVCPKTINKYADEMRRFNMGPDCPIFDGLFELCQIVSGGSIAAAKLLNSVRSEICINWSGGMHHAKKSEASGFCYINDIVLGILELLKVHRRVLYIDIDVHHGDGVEEAFYTTDRVMTLNFHQYGNFFPGTGHILDIGAERGKYYALNVPLSTGMDDYSYESIFSPIVCKTMEHYRPEAIVMQCGADSLSGDRLGGMNLTIKGHGKCVELVRGFNVPLLMLGGGGYSLCNVARCWTYETAIAVGVDLSDEIPYNSYLEYYGPTYNLHLSPTNMPNKNSFGFLQRIKERIFDNLRMMPHAPGVQMQLTPESFIDSDDDDEDATNKDERVSQRDKDTRISANNEFYNSDSSEDGYDASDVKPKMSNNKFLKTILIDAPRTGPRTPPRTGPRTPPGTPPRTGPRTPPGPGPRTPPRTGPRTPARTGPRTPPRTGPRTPPRTGPRTPPRTGPRTPPRTPPRTKATPFLKSADHYLKGKVAKKSQHEKDGTPKELEKNPQFPLHGMEILVLVPKGKKNGNIEKNATQIEVVPPIVDSDNNLFDEIDSPDDDDEYADREKGETSIDANSHTLKVDEPAATSEALPVEATQIEEVRPIDKNTNKDGRNVADAILTVAEEPKTNDAAPEMMPRKRTSMGIIVRRSSTRNTKTGISPDQNSN